MRLPQLAMVVLLLWLLYNAQALGKNVDGFLHFNAN